MIHISVITYEWPKFNGAQLIIHTKQIRPQIYLTDLWKRNENCACPEVEKYANEIFVNYDTVHIFT